MGFNLSWIALKTARADALNRTGYRVGKRTTSLPFELSLAVAELPTGWTIIHTDDVMLPTKELLTKLSKGITVIACQVHEGAMFSIATCYVDGKEAWSVAHDGQDGPDDLATSGTMPPQFKPIMDRQIAKQAANQGSNVDFMFDIPIDLAFELTSFVHSRAKFEFTELHAPKP